MFNKQSTSGTATHQKAIVASTNIFKGWGSLATLLLLLITAANAFGTATATTTVLKAGLTSAPTVAITTASFGASVTLTATVTPSTAVGAVTFKLGGVAIGNPVAVSSGTATLATSALALGANSLTAVFIPTSSLSFVTSTSGTSTVTVAQATTTTALLAGLTSAPTVAITTASFGASVTLTATVTPAAAAGNVTFKLGGVAIGSPVAVSSGTASIATSALALGANSLTAAFTPTTVADFAASASGTSTVTVAQATTTTGLLVGLTSSPSVPISTAVAGASVTLTATVTPAAASGNVTFKLGGVAIGSPVAVSSGTATMATSALAVGVDSLTAAFTPTTIADYGSSASGASSVTVTKPTTTTALIVSAGPYYYGSSVTLTANLTPSAATGSVNFMNGVTQVGTCTLGSGTCNTTVSTLPVASNTLTAVYAGDGTYATSTSGSSGVNVVTTPTQVTLTSSLPTIMPSTSITLTATVSPAASSGSATISSGSVTFYDSSTSLGKATVNSSGVATLTTTSVTTAGSHYLIALYGGSYSSGTTLFGVSLSSSAKVVVSDTLAPTISHWYDQSVKYGSTVTFAATSNSDGALTYSVLSGPGTILGSTLTPTGVGPITVGLTEAAGTYYHAITDPTVWEKTVMVYQAPLLITAASPTVAYGAAVPTINPIYTTLVNGDTGSSLATAPTCKTAYTTANHPGTFISYCYGAVAQNYSITYATGLVTATKATPTIATLPTASQITYGARLSTSTLTSGLATVTPASGLADVAGVFSWGTGTTIPRVGSTQAVTFTPTDTTDYTNAGTTMTANVAQATPIITVEPIASAAAYNTALGTSRLTGGTSTGISGNIPGVYTWTTTSTTLTTMGLNSESVTFSPSDSNDYTTATGATNVNVIKATPIVSPWPSASAISYGAALSTSSLTGGSATPSGGAFAWTTGAAIPTVGSPAESVTYTPTDTVHYGNATGTVHITVNKLTATIVSSPTASPITYGQTLVSSKLSGGSATVPGTFAWTTSSTQPGAGTPSESVTFTPSNSALYASVTGSVNVTVNQASPTVSLWPTATSITMSETLGSSTLGSGTSTPSGGSFGWTNSSATLVPGTSLYSVTYTPADTTDYADVIGAVNVTVNPCGYQDIANSAYSTAMYLFDANDAPSVPASVDVEGTNLSAVCAVNANASDTTITPTVTYPFITSNAVSSNATDSSSYGLNAAVLAYGTANSVGTGATITIADDGSGDPGYISTGNDNSSGVFASEGGIVNITDTIVTTSGNKAHALAATYSGTLAIVNVQASTAGTNSSAILAGVGGGTVTVNGGSYTTSGSLSSAIRAAGTGSSITVTDANTSGTTISAANGTAVAIEGGNTVTITSTVGTSLSGALGANHGIYLYEGNSGDATAGPSSFTMTNGSISYTCDATATAACATGVPASGQNTLATLFSVANTTATINLTDVSVTNDTPTNTNSNGTLLTAAALDGGTASLNGGNAIFNAFGENLTGDVIVDSISTVALSLAADSASSPVPSTLTGAINNANSGALTVSLTLDATSSWVVTADSYLTSLVNPVAGNTNITCATSCTVYVNETPIVIGN